MTDQTPQDHHGSAAPDPRTPPSRPTPGERRLDRPPSERYRAAEPTEDTSGTGAVPATGGSLVRAMVAGDAAALVGAVATVVLGGVLSVSAGLLVVAAAAGWAVGQAVVIGGGTPLASRRALRPWVAVSSALLGVVIGQVGLWWYAGTEGGVLPLVDYLGQTFGVLVPLQAALACAIAWWTAR